MSDLGALAVSVSDAATMIRARHGYTLDEVTGCWLFPVRGPGGLGPFRAFYVAAYGEPPEGFRIVHTCGGASVGCVRPGHLDLLAPGQERRPRRGASLPVDAAEAFAAKLRDEREALGMTQAEFAKLLRCSPSTVGDYERGASAPDVHRYAEIVQALGWDGAPRRFLVTAVVQRVVVATSAGEAGRRTREELDRDDQPGKVALYRVEAIR